MINVIKSLYDKVKICVKLNNTFLSFEHPSGLLFCSASEMLDNHKSVLNFFGIQANNDELELPYIYWIPKDAQESI